MKIALVGSPNVGKSVIFHHLTGQYVTVSNYPGTTVEVTWGSFKWQQLKADVVDTPGMYSLLPISREEEVTRELLFMEHPDLVVHVMDAKNVSRMLSLTLQLLETGLTVVLVLNMMDEARKCGLHIDCEALADRLGIPVIPAVSITGEGMEELQQWIGRYMENFSPDGVEKSSQEQSTSVTVDEQKILENPTRSGTEFLRYPPRIENGLRRVERHVKGDYSISQRSLALFLLQGDQEIWEWVEDVEEPSQADRIWRVIGSAEAESERHQVTTQILLTRQKKAEEIVRMVLDQSGVQARKWQSYLSQLCTHPVTGIPILLLVLYFGLYKFVGVLGAGVIVDFFDRVIFQQGLNPFLTHLIGHVLPWETLQTLFVGEYGILTLGVRYAVAIILPLVGMFFFAFSILEDSGYFPRLALLVDRVFHVIGLNGRAVIPMVLGLGCDTMATLTTRILETRRERILATLLLALAIPCSAQLGVITSLLASEPGGLLIWIVVILGVLILVGASAKRVLPGEEVGFYMEVPTLRWPKLSNIFAKTRARMGWYFLEVLPVFMYSSVVIWIGQITGLFQQIVSWLHPLMLALGLPKEASVTFLFGFFRRDYGAAGLFDLYRQGAVTGDGLIVACITLTLFVPCVAQWAVMLKELGWKAGILISGFIFPFAFLVGYLVHWFLGIM